MTDDGRLELDEDGDVVDRSGSPSTLVDLADPHATEALSATALDSWVARSAAPWVRTHRRALAGLTAGVLALSLGAAWWTTRPAPPASPPALTLADAPVVGGDLGGPRITSEGAVSVAYTARARADVRSVGVLGIRGPGLIPTGVEAGADSVAAGELAFVQLGARLDCTDRALASAVPSSYGVLLRLDAEAGGAGPESLQQFDSSTTALDIALRDACLAGDLPTSVSVVAGEIADAAGSSVADLRLTVRNDAEVPLSVTTERTPSTTVETDLSPTVVVAPHGSGVVSTRVLVHDCAAPPKAPALLDLPGPVPARGAAAAGSRAGITVRLGLGDRWTTVSYALPWSVAELSRELAATACADPPNVSARLVDVAGLRSIDGSWLVTGTYDVRTSGIGISLGREHFSGAAVPGSSLATTDSLVPGVRWVLAPTQLDGGAGRLPVTFSGTSCADRDRGVPTSMAVQVTAASRSVYPFELPLDPAVLRRAVDAACSDGSVVSVPGWGEVTPGATPAA